MYTITQLLWQKFKLLKLGWHKEYPIEIIEYNSN